MQQRYTTNSFLTSRFLKQQHKRNPPARPTTRKLATIKRVKRMSHGPPCLLSWQKWLCLRARSCGPNIMRTGSGTALASMKFWKRRIRSASRSCSMATGFVCFCLCCCFVLVCREKICQEKICGVHCPCKCIHNIVDFVFSEVVHLADLKIEV